MLYCSLQIVFCFLKTNWRFLTTWYWANPLLLAIFPMAFVHFVFLCHILVILTFQNFSLLFYVTVTCDQCSLQKIDLSSTSQAQMMLSIFNNSIFKLRYICCCSNIMLLNTQQDSVNNFYMYWETKKFILLALLWYSLYCSGLELSLHYLGGMPINEFLSSQREAWKNAILSEDQKWEWDSCFAFFKVWSLLPSGKIKIVTGGPITIQTPPNESHLKLSTYRTHTVCLT